MGPFLTAGVRFPHTWNGVEEGVLFVGEISLPRSRTVLLGAWIEIIDNPSGQRTSLATLAERFGGGGRPRVAGITMARSQPSQDLLCSIGRAVLDYQKLKLSERLAQNALDRIPHTSSRIPNRQ